MTDLNQYSRRENIEIQNIPETVLQKDLEQYVISMLSSIGVSIDSWFGSSSPFGKIEAAS